ncbi:MAG: N-acetylmuramoyl-L-alanine amidase [Mangrovibacterium sp.]
MDSKRYLLFFILLLILVAGHAAFAEKAPGKTFTVVIDPGHGGQDPGAVYKNIREKDIVLRLALKLGSYIRQNMPETKVIFTRDRDVFIPLHQRAAIANTSKADLFISLHANFCGTPSISGTETFVLGLHRSEENLEVAKKENSVILMEKDYTARYEGFDPNSSESYIMFEMVQDEYLNQSITIGALVQEEFKSRALRSDRGVKQAGFLVLREIGMPGILIESGFLSNHAEAQYLNSEKGQTNLATAIYHAFKAYKSSVETKSDFRLIAQENVQKELNAVLSEAKSEIKTQPKAALEQIIHDEQIIRNERLNPEKVVQNEIWFSVQIAAATSKIEPSPSNFKGLKTVDVIEHNGRFKYMYGKETSYKEIVKRRSEARKYFPDAFIVAFKNGKLVPVKDVINNQKP